MPQDRSRIFDGGADVEVLRLRIVGRNEIEAGRVLVVNSGRIHEAAGTSRLERFRQLPDLKWAEIIRQGDELMLLQKINHLLFAAFIGFQK